MRREPIVSLTAYHAHTAAIADRFDRKRLLLVASDRPEAAVIATEFGSRTQLDPMVMPDAPGEWVAHVIERGLAHASGSGFEAVGLDEDVHGSTRPQVDKSTRPRVRKSTRPLVDSAPSSAKNFNGSMMFITFVIAAGLAPNVRG